LESVWPRAADEVVVETAVHTGVRDSPPGCRYGGVDDPRATAAAHVHVLDVRLPVQHDDAVGGPRAVAGDGEIADGERIAGCHGIGLVRRGTEDVAHRTVLLEHGAGGAAPEVAPVAEQHDRAGEQADPALDADRRTGGTRIDRPLQRGCVGGGAGAGDACTARRHGPAAGWSRAAGCHGTRQRGHRERRCRRSMNSAACRPQDSPFSMAMARQPVSLPGPPPPPAGLAKQITGRLMASIPAGRAVMRRRKAVLSWVAVRRGRLAVAITAWAPAAAARIVDGMKVIPQRAAAATRATGSPVAAA